MKTIVINDSDEDIAKFIKNQKNISRSITEILKKHILENGVGEVIENSFYTRSEYYNLIKHYLTENEILTMKAINKYLIELTEDKINRDITKEERSLAMSKIRSAIGDLKKDNIIESVDRGIYKKI